MKSCFIMRDLSRLCLFPKSSQRPLAVGTQAAQCDGPESVLPPQQEPEPLLHLVRELLSLTFGNEYPCEWKEGA